MMRPRYQSSRKIIIRIRSGQSRLHVHLLTPLRLAGVFCLSFSYSLPTLYSTLYTTLYYTIHPKIWWPSFQPCNFFRGFQCLRASSSLSDNIVDFLSVRYTYRRCRHTDIHSQRHLTKSLGGNQLGAYYFPLQTCTELSNNNFFLGHNYRQMMATN